MVRRALHDSCPLLHTPFYRSYHLPGDGASQECEFSRVFARLGQSGDGFLCLILRYHRFDFGFQVARHCVDKMRDLVPLDFKIRLET